MHVWRFETKADQAGSSLKSGQDFVADIVSMAPKTGPGTPGKMSSVTRQGMGESPAVLHLVEGNSMMRDIDRAPPGDVVRRAGKHQMSANLSKKRSNYFSDAFPSSKESKTAKEVLRSDAIVMADVKTNVIISDEFTFITELSIHLSVRYQRPVSSIVITLQHGACMLFGGTFEPAYVMAIFALSPQVLPTTNKRNAALIQKHMEEAIGVDPCRGFLRFIPIREEHIARNGQTMAGEMDELGRMERMEKSYSSTTDDLASTASRSSKPRHAMSVKSFGNSRMAPDMTSLELTPPPSAGDPLKPKLLSQDRVPAMPEEARQKSPKRKKSFVASLFGRSSTKI